jgi:hypothetical protein
MIATRSACLAKTGRKNVLPPPLRALAVRINGADAIRQDVLDIAAELEAE